MASLRSSAPWIAGTLVIAAFAWYGLRLPFSRVEAVFARELRPGTSPNRVTAVLDSLGGESGSLYYSTTGGSDFKGRGYLLYGALRGWRVRLAAPLADGIFMVFRFNEDYELLEYVAHYSYTMP